PCPSDTRQNHGQARYPHHQTHPIHYRSHYQKSRHHRTSTSGPPPFSTSQQQNSYLNLPSFTFNSPLSYHIPLLPSPISIYSESSENSPSGTGQNPLKTTPIQENTTLSKTFYNFANGDVFRCIGTRPR